MQGLLAAPIPDEIESAELIGLLQVFKRVVKVDRAETGQVCWLLLLLNPGLGDEFRGLDAIAGCVVRKGAGGS